MKHYAKPLFITAFAVLFVSFCFTLSYKLPTEGAPLMVSITRTVSPEESAKISTIRLRGETERYRPRVTYLIGDYDHISFEHNKSKNGNKDVFDINQTPLKIADGVLDLHILSASSYRKASDLTIKLPQRDWKIEQLNGSTPRITNQGKPINLTIVGNKPFIKGSYDEVNIWRLGPSNLVALDNTPIRTLNIRGYELKIKVEYDDDKDLGNIFIHGNVKKFNTDNIEVLPRVKWQPLNKSEIDKISSYHRGD